MAAVGRKVMPLTIKQVRGSRNVKKHQKLSEEATTIAPIEPGASIPPPDWMPKGFAREEWERLCPVMIENKLLTTANITFFGLMCVLAGRLVQDVKDNPTNCLTNTNAVNQYRLICAEFGLTPSASLKAKPVGLGSAPESGNPFESNKPEARRKAA